MYLYAIMQDFWDTLIGYDQALFSKINGSWTNSLLDKVLPWARTSEHWIPFYVILLVFIIYKWKAKTIKWVLLAVVNVAITDQISSNICKPFFHRLRPCNDPAIMHQSRLLIDHCLTSFSFTSSHAANHFGFAIFMYITLRPLFKNFSYLFFLWAGIISYAQVYIGVHYPIDVIMGAAIGVIVGYAAAKLFGKWVQH
jgi:undecaprenyl-diphosphatase